MKKIFLLCLTLCLVLGLAGTGTFAYFSTTETSRDNTFTAGDMSLEFAEVGATGSAGFHMDEIFPGDKSSAVFYVKNTSQISGILFITGILVSNAGGEFCLGEVIEAGTNGKTLFEWQSEAEFSSLWNEDTGVGVAIAANGGQTAVTIPWEMVTVSPLIEDEVIGKGNANKKRFSFTLANGPIEAGFGGGGGSGPVPGPLVITDGTEIFTDDDGSGILTGDAGGSGTIDYQTGVGEVIFNVAPGFNQEIVADYQSEFMNMYQGVTVSVAIEFTLEQDTTS